ncbi:Queuine tRNA-ribosyltransferase [Hibiscus syriacus]|uniref:Queuine tRNA-ribosyltransferase n=1 Tax=Hibiscus syriacus TaxID=106335 RepID=A0A6A2WCU9_HIBSY|nr:Queuine tRNA-ribosyltransferase [Hibiscus syriacus]
MTLMMATMVLVDSGQPPLTPAVYSTGGRYFTTLDAILRMVEDGFRTQGGEVDSGNGYVDHGLTRTSRKMVENRIGADIIMALDDVVKTTITGPRIEEAMYRTLRWIDRCIEGGFRSSTKVNLLSSSWDICVRGLVDRNLPGYAIGGLAGGEDKDSFWRVVAQCTAALPEDKPRYVMGVGYPLDIVVCSALGADMYDCVYPTRTARFGTALVPEGVLKLKHNAMAEDTRSIYPTCACMVCMRLSAENGIFISLSSCLQFFENASFLVFPKGDVPEWVCNAMEVAEIDIMLRSFP